LANRLDHARFNRRAYIFITKLTMNKIYLSIGGLLLLLAVITGAFGAHLIENQLGPKAAGIFDTGVKYQFYHGLGIILVEVIRKDLQSRLLRFAIYSFVVGIICFSGSLYVLAFKDMMGPAIQYVGPITPIGGLFFVIGWTLFIAGVLRAKPKIN